MKKCDICDKSITKKCPGVECRRCEKCVHLSSECSGLTTKQQVALRSSNLLWLCQECELSTSKRKSIVIPEGEDEETEEAADKLPFQIDVKQLLKDISIEMEKTVRKELAELSGSLQYHSDQMEELEKTIHEFKTSIKDLQKKNTELSHLNTHLLTRVGALEQRVQSLEQERLSSAIELSNIPREENENITEIVKTVARKLKTPTTNIRTVQRQGTSKDRPGNIIVHFSDDADCITWTSASKAASLLIADVCPSVKEPKASEKIFDPKKMSTNYLNSNPTHSVPLLSQNANSLKNRGMEEKRSISSSSTSSAATTKAKKLAAEAVHLRRMAEIECAKRERDLEREREHASTILEAERSVAEAEHRAEMTAIEAIKCATSESREPKAEDMVREERHLLLHSQLASLHEAYAQVNSGKAPARNSRLKNLRLFVEESTNLLRLSGRIVWWKACLLYHRTP
ncbi:general transcriptional corepressor trfA-like [Hyposmocoma kahamanoa]|uniref:general transcriptional corepressor trfA-like n=1 Tax=Hyposmocoma kahamanoa TaxID=1477025 RepID=UPI000E6D6376|nr:general transcriptional corepressor trfA-like [Hyposmocoma kahamanoa]